MKPLILLIFAFLFLLSPIEAATAESALPVLKTAQEIRQLSPDEARRGYPVRIEGVVLYYRQGRESGELIVQDSTLGIFVRASPPQRYTLSAGDIVQIEGVSDPGKFAPVIILSRLRVTGHGPLPPAREVTYERLLAGADDSQWVRARGIVHSAENLTVDGLALVQMELAVSGGRISVRVLGLDLPAHNSLIGAEVTVTGACATIFNNRRQLLNVRIGVQSADQLVIETSAPVDLEALPVQPINSLHQYNSPATLGRLVKVRGTVLFRENDKSIFIRDQTQALWIQTRQTANIAVGDEIDVLGFPASREFVPILEDASWRKVSSGLAPVPVILDAVQAKKGEFANDLVQLEAQLIDSFSSPSEHMLLLQADGVMFRALLPRGMAGSLSLPPAGSRLRVSGICLMRVDTSRWPESFHLLVRSPADVQVFEQPSWWTASRLLWALGSMAALVIAVSCWGITLRRRVRQQTEIIQDKIRRTAMLEERTRIARDFHDTLEQQLAAIALQIQVVRSRFESSPEVARQVLLGVESMLRHTRSEARHSVWELRARVLENGSLGDALATIAAFARNELPVEMKVTVSGEPRPLTGQIENNLLRIGQEAATNAVKHGQAKHIEIKLSYDPAAVHLCVEDDGRGFEVDSAPAGPAGHFGLLGMRERAEKIGGQLEVASAPGRGARVGVLVPLPEPQAIA